VRNRRLAIALVAFVLWTAITIVGGNITTGGKGTLLEGVTSGIGWTWVVAAAFVLAVVLWQGWRDVGLDRLPEPRSLQLAWLPMISTSSVGWCWLPCSACPPPRPSCC
jgi:hypothetical protein